MTGCSFKFKDAPEDILPFITFMMVNPLLLAAHPLFFLSGQKDLKTPGLVLHKPNTPSEPTETLQMLMQRHADVDLQTVGSQHI